MPPSSPAAKSLLLTKPTSPGSTQSSNLNSLTTNNSIGPGYNSICAIKNGTASMLSNRTNTNHDNPLDKVADVIYSADNVKHSNDNGCRDQLYNDVKSILNSLLDRLTFDENILESRKEPTAANINSEILSDTKLDLNSISTVTVSQASSFVQSGTDIALTTTSLIRPVHDLDDEETNNKDIVTLRNLEITPPPQPLPSEEPTQPPTQTEQTQAHRKLSKRGSKRNHSDSTTEQSDDQSETGGRSKRQRKQTQLFQVEKVTPRTAPRISSLNQHCRSTSKRSTAVSSTKTSESSKRSKKQTERQPQRIHPQQQPPPQQVPMSNEHQDVIFYEKNDYLAIRNDEDAFYLCQLTENVRVQRPQIKVRWLDTKDDGKSYFLTSQYDKVPQKSILMPVELTKSRGDKKGQQILYLADEVKATIMDRLRRSLNFPSESEQ